MDTDGHKSYISIGSISTGFKNRTNETVTILCENVMYNLIMCVFFIFLIQSKKPININHFLPHDKEL